MLQTSLQKNFSYVTKGNIVKAVNGTLALDDVINEIALEKYADSRESLLAKEKICTRLDILAEKYLTDSEKLVYYLVKDRKSVTDIEKIMKFGCWYTAENHVIKIMRILKIYYKYHCLDLKSLQKILRDEFTDYERKIIKGLHNKKTYDEITKELNSYYRKIYYDCADIFSKLESINENTKGYAVFLKEIRKFKRKD